MSGALIIRPGLILFQQSRIMDAKYFQEKPQPEEEKLDNEFKARLPRKLEHVVRHRTYNLVDQISLRHQVK